MRVWTIGHSTLSLDAFTATLRRHGVALAADVRAFPGSRRYPHFARQALERSLPECGLRYAWLGRELGGRRRSSPAPSQNLGLRNASFRNYADYMRTPEFRAGIAALLALAAEAPIAIFCAELLWWRCHRSLIADYLVAVERCEVLHIMGEAEPKPHRVKPEARLEDGGLVYGLQPDLPIDRP